MERKRRFQTRQQYAEHKAKETKFQKVDKRLHYLIGLVALLIVATLIFILTGEDDQAPKQEAALEKQPTEPVVKEASTEDDEEADAQAGNSETEDSLIQQPVETANTVTSSTQPSVQEVWTNPSWQAYPTAQTGTHESIYKAGHVDYEEKLKAVFSVLDIEQQDSFILNVKNNGNAKNAIAVVTSKDRQQQYRVSIEWIDKEGWKPLQVEVLTSTEGMY